MSSLVKFLSVSEGVRQRWRRRHKMISVRNWYRWWRKSWPPRRRPRWFREVMVFLYLYGKKVIYNQRYPQYLSDFDR